MGIGGGESLLCVKALMVDIPMESYLKPLGHFYLTYKMIMMLSLKIVLFRLLLSFLKFSKQN